MINITVKTRDGAPHHLEGRDGVSLMETIRDNGIDELLALCGGCCSCATCHVFVKEGPDESKSPGSDDEDDLLDSSDVRGPGSRLACQLELTGELQGLVVQIAPKD